MSEENMASENRVSEIPENLARSAPPKEVDIQLNLYSLSVDAKIGERLHGLKVGSGSPSNNGDGVYAVHMGRLSKKVSIKAGEETLKLYNYGRGGSLIVNDKEKPAPAIDNTLIEIINDSLGGNVKLINEPTLRYNRQSDENAIIFVDCRSVLADHRLFPFVRRSVDGENWSTTYKQIFNKTYSSEAFHIAGEVARKAYSRICEEFSDVLKPDVIYVAFLIAPRSRVPIALMTYDPSNSLLESVPMLFGARWSNTIEGAKLKTIAPNGTWDEYIEDIGKKYIAISKNETLDWASFERAWKNSIFNRP